MSSNRIESQELGPKNAGVAARSAHQGERLSTSSWKFAIFAWIAGSISGFGLNRENSFPQGPYFKPEVS